MAFTKPNMNFEQPRRRPFMTRILDKGGPDTWESNSIKSNLEWGFGERVDEKIEIHAVEYFGIIDEEGEEVSWGDVVNTCRGELYRELKW